MDVSENVMLAKDIHYLEMFSFVHLNIYNIKSWYDEDR